MSSFKRALKSMLRPLRTLSGRFVVLPNSSEATIVWKAAQITSAERVEGDYFEFGVFRGDSFIQAFKSIESVYRWRYTDAANTHSPQYREDVRHMWDKMRFLAFDSFQGLPGVSGLDALSNDFVQGMFSCGVDDFITRLKANNVDMEKVVVIPGWFADTCREETAKTYRLRAASIVHIDCDLYESTKIVLDFIAPFLVDGTVLIFDDWYCFRGNPNLGEQRAFREWAESKPDWIFAEYQKEGATRESFIANRR